MNLVIGTRYQQARQFRPHTVAVAFVGAVALALAAASGAIVFSGASSGVDQAALQQARLAAIMTQPVPEAPDIVFYIVNSEADRDVVQTSLDQAAWIAVEGNFNPAPIRNVILVASDAAQEAEVSRIIGESSSADAHSGNKIEVYDLRK
jgi:hypothetical protein